MRNETATIPHVKRVLGCPMAARHCLLTPLLALSLFTGLTAAPIEHYVARRIAEYTTTTAGWSNVPGDDQAAGTVASGQGWIDNTNFASSIGDRYLIMVFGSYNNSNNGSRCGIQVTHNGVVFPTSVCIHEADRTGAAYKTPYFWFTEWTAANEDLDIEIQRSANTSRVEDITMIAMNVENLIASGDFYCDYNNDAGALNTTWTPKETISFTPTTAADTWWIAGFARADIVEVNGNDFEARLAINDATLYSDFEMEGEDNADYPVHGLGWITTLPASLQKIEVEIREDGNNQEWESAGVFALRLNAFNKFAYEANPGDGINMDANNTWREQANVDPCNPVQGNWLIAAGAIIDDNNGRTRTRIQLAEANITDNTGGWQHNTNDRVPYMIADFQEALAVGDRDFDFDGMRNANNDAQAEDAWIVAFSMELYSGPKTWTGLGADGKWNTSANWSGSNVPSQCDDVFFDSAAKGCTLDVSPTIKSITFTGDYTANFNFADQTLSVTGDVDFSTGGTITPGTGTLEFVGSSAQTFIPKSGQTFPEIEKDGTGVTTVSTNGFTANTLSIEDGVFNLGVSLTHTVGTVTTPGGTGGGLNFSSSTLEATGDVTLNGAGFSLIPGTGTLKFTGTGTQTFTPDGAAHPDILHNGSGTLTLGGNFVCDDFTQSAGILDFNARDISVNGNFLIQNGTSTTIQGLTGVVIDVDGTADLNGTSGSLLNLDGGAWSIDMNNDGALNAMFASIDHSTVPSAPPRGQAEECVDGGSNTPNDWDFIADNYADWNYSRKVYTNTTASGADVSGNVRNFPMLVRLDTDNIDFSEVVSATGADMRFAKADGLHLKYQIEDWNDGTDATIWVRLDTVYGNNNTQYFTMYWGKSGAVDRSSGSNVFQTSNNFLGVWHLDENGNTAAGGYKSSTGSYDGTGVSMTGASDVASLVGTGQNFDGTWDYIDLPAIPNQSTATVSCWMKYDTWDYENGLISMVQWANGAVHFKISTNASLKAHPYSSGSGADFGGQLVAGTWYHCLFTYENGGNCDLFIDGERVASKTAGAYNLLCSQLEIAHEYQNYGAGDRYFDGIIDEGRVEGTVRSDDWIKLCYESQRENSNTLNFPKVWDGGGIDGKWNTDENWTGNAAPAATDDVLFNATSVKGCTLDVDATVNAITFFSGYTGEFNFGSTAKKLSVKSTADFSSGGTVEAGDGTLEFTGTAAQSFVPLAGETFPAITQNGAGGTTIASSNLSAGVLTITSGTLDLSDEALTHTVSSVSTSAGSIDFGNSTLQTSGAANLNGGSFSITPDNGVLEFTGGGSQTFTPKTGGSHPAISHTGTGTMTLGANFSCVSFSQSNGILALGGYDITTSGNFAMSNGKSNTLTGLANCFFTVGGSANFNGGGGTDSLNLDAASRWDLDATGPINANFCVVGYGWCTAANHGQAVNGCRDASNNNFWDFLNEDYDGGSWSSNRRYYINTTSTGADVSGDATNFPLLMRLDPGDFPGAQGDGDDIRFETSGGTPLSYERERWAGGNAEVWVLMPTVYGNNKSQYITMYWGNGAASTRSDPDAVFGVGSDYIGDWHLLENGNNNANGYVSATGVNHGKGESMHGGSDVAGIIGVCQNFDGANDRINVSSSASMNALDKMTVTGWARTDDNTDTDQAMFSFYYNGSDFAFIALDNSTQGIRVWNNINGRYEYNATTNWVPTNDTWFHFAWVIDGTNEKIYLNGALEVSVGQDLTMVDLDDGFTASMAQRGQNDYRWNGMLDEIGLAKVARNQHWVKLAYETQKQGADCIYSSNSPAVTGPSDSGVVAASQSDADSVIVRYEVEDPQGGTVTIIAQYKVSGGSWQNMTQTRGEGSGIDASDGSVEREVGWNARAQLGAVENTYYVRIIADDGSNQDTTESDAFGIDTRGPSGLGSFATSNVTGSTIDLSWDAVNDANFSHYEIWFGTSQAQVESRTDNPPSSDKWDSTDVANLKTISTENTTVTGLTYSTTYYFRIYAVDTWGNEDSAGTINATTLNAISPTWTKSGLGTILGGTVGEGRLFLGCGTGSKALKCLDLDNSGNVLWSVSTLPDNCGRPTYYYSESEVAYLIVAAAGNKVIGEKDDEIGDPDHLFSTSITNPGTPYITLDGDYFFVAYGTQIGKYDMSDGSSVGGWPITPTYAPSSSADMVLYNDYLYVATAGPRILKTDMDGTPVNFSGTLTGGGSINLPLGISRNGGTIYATPNTSKLIAVDVSGATPSESWDVNLPAANTGPSFVVGKKVYVACGNYVQRVSDDGSPALDWASPLNLGGTINSGPILFGDVVYVGRNSGELHALKDSDGTNYDASKWPYTGASGDADTGPWIDIENDRILYGTDGGEVHAFEKQP